jgi:hypothetical protein
MATDPVPPPLASTAPLSTSAPAPAAEPDGAAPKARALAMLSALRDWIASGLTGLPEAQLHEIAELIARHPETGETFLAALRGGDRSLWRLIGNAFILVHDQDLRSRLIAEQRGRDPVRQRLKEVLEDGAKALGALENREDPSFRMRVIDSMPDALLDKPGFRAEVRRIATSDPDARTRGRAIFRLARSNTPEDQKFLLGILTDTSRRAQDRQTAAMGLSFRSSPELRDAFLAILDRGDSEPIRLFAVRGLAPYASDPAVAEVLLTQLESTSNPDRIRIQAASGLARGLPDLPPANRDAVLVRVKGLATDLATSGSDQEVFLHVLGEICRSVGSDFFADVREIASHVSSEGLRRRLVADVQLKQVWENR